MTTQSSDEGATNTGAALEQYRLAVEMADRISGRRQSANAFFISIISALTVTNGSGIVSEWYWTITVSGAAMLVCFMWWRLLASYRAINSAKFKVIHEIERELPFAMFAEEERHYKSSRRTGYKPLSRIEQAIPALFAAVSLVSAIASAVVR